MCKNRWFLIYSRFLKKYLFVYLCFLAVEFWTGFKIPRCGSILKGLYSTPLISIFNSRVNFQPVSKFFVTPADKFTLLSGCHKIKTDVKIIIRYDSFWNSDDGMTNVGIVTNVGLKTDLWQKIFRETGVWWL